MKQVRETSAGKSISVYVILNKKGEEVATVQAHYANGGRVTVNVWQTSLALDNCCKRPDLWSQLPAGQDYKSAACELWGFQESHAGGYGYDKFTAALAGLIIDGHTLANHCGQVPEAEKARAAILKAYEKECRANGGNAVESRTKYWRERAAKIGAHWANWGFGDSGRRYSSLHFIAGLHRLECLGYRVIKAI